MQRVNQTPNETMKRIPMPIAPASSSSIHPGNNSTMPDLLWISKQQQQHPSTHAHALKNTIRVSSNGIRHKFDGKLWRPLCVSTDGYECRNLAFRSSLCQKHFYKLHISRRPYGRNGPLPPPLPGMPPLSLKRPLSHPYEHQQHHHHPPNDAYDNENEHEDMYEDDDSIQVLENNDPMMIKLDKIETQNESQSEFTFFTIDCDSQSELDKHEINHLKSASLPKKKTIRFNK